jgi:hypothetical protein
LSDEDCRESLGRQAQINATKYSWPKIVEQMVRVYSSLVLD